MTSSDSDPHPVAGWRPPEAGDTSAQVAPTRDGAAGGGGGRSNPSDAGYPVIFDLVGRRCLVVGGGPIAARRADGMVAAGGTVTVVAPRTTPELEASAVIAIEHRPYRAGEAGGYDMVATATGDPTVDRQVVSDAASAGVPVAGADRSAPGTVSLPAVRRQGPVTLTVSTAGSSPALSRWLLARAAASLPRDVAVIASLLEETRARLRAEGRSTDSVDWDAVLSGHVVPLVEAGRVDEARGVLGRL